MSKRSRRESARKNHRIGRRSATRPQHRTKQAVVYVHTSTVDEQTAAAGRVLVDVLVERARALGWPAERVKISEDLGCPALANHRPGLEQLQALLDARAVGLVVTHDLSRITRDPVQLQKFLLSVKRAGALIDVNGEILDVNEKILELNNQIYVSSILALIRQTQ